uniref:Pectinesterase inhibitor domain-containing protein n=1 Tax=Oryza punctata TaxID=4537 RepID=A0A0E0LR44_ORYPU
MEKPTILSVVTLSLTAAFLLTGGDACDGAPRMSAVDACKQASTADVMWQLCVRMLGTSPEPKEVTCYVFTAMNSNIEQYVISYEAADKVRQDASSSQQLSTACDTCMRNYDVAKMKMVYSRDRLRSCDLSAETRVDLLAAVVAVDDCATLLLRAGGDKTPLHRMVLLDRDRAVLLLRLAILLLPNKS